MQQILILGGGAAGLAAALAAAQTAEGRAHITVLDKNAKVGKKLLATGNGRCNLDNRAQPRVVPAAPRSAAAGRCRAAGLLRLEGLLHGRRPSARNFQQ